MSSRADAVFNRLQISSGNSFDEEPTGAEEDHVHPPDPPDSDSGTSSGS
jgi:hypothetical protein